METKYDIVIIGSGLGGLSCAYILSKNGYKVAVLEQAKQLGGCLQTFARKGAKFETGMHYIGSMKEGQALHRYFNYLALFPQIKLSPLDPLGFELISLGGEQYKYASGYDDFVEQLVSKFPQEYQNLKNYTRKLQEIAEQSPFHSLQNVANDNTQIALMLSNYETCSVNDFIASFTSNERLQNVLAATSPLYAGVKDKTPMYIHALINESNINGAYRLMGGSDQIATSLANSIRSFGGNVFTSSKVSKINCDNYKATHITLADGTRINADYIISNAHPERTLDMIDSNLIRPIYRKRICNIEQTVSNFTLYIRFKDNRVPYMNHNHYIYRGNNVWDCEHYTEQNWPRNYIYLHLCPEKESPYAEAAEVLAYMRFEEMEPWFNTKRGYRGETYEEFKQRKAEKLLSLIEKDYPGTLANIDSYYTSSPLTYLDYTGTTKGSTYGILHNKSTFVSSRISHRTKIPNLFFTGQNINAHGIMGVIIGALIVCSDFLGREFLLKQVLEKK